MLKKLCTLSTLLFAACGDDTKSGNPDAGTTPDTAVETDAMVDAAVTWTKPTPFKIPVSATAPDVAMSAAAGPAGTFYVAGWVADTATAGAPKHAYIARLTSAGALDTTFNAGGTIPGIYISTVEFKGGGNTGAGSDEIDIVVQSTGHIVMSFSIANDVDADDRDIGVIRVSSGGALDTDYGTAGLARVNLSTAFDNAGTPVAPDQARSLALGPSDTIYLHAVARDAVANGGNKQDTEFAVAKLDSDGALDTANYGGGDGFYLLDINNSQATPRALAVLSTGAVIASGYANSTFTNSVQPVFYKLTPAGASDTSWASGLFHDSVLAIQTEIYHFNIDGDRITTAGYGRAVNEGSSTTCCNDWVSMRFDTSTGVRNTSFGGATDGAVLIDVDPAAALNGHNCRGATGINGGKTVLIGSAGNGGARNAAFAILTQGGQLDTSYGTGYATWDLDAGTEDQFWAGASNGGKLLLAGWRGLSAQADTANMNDDSYAVLIDLQ